MDDSVWQLAPAAALRLWHDAQGLQVRANAAAMRWAAGQGLVAADWQALAADASRPGSPACARWRVGAALIEVEAQRVDLADGGLLLWLQPTGATGPLLSARRSAEFLERALSLAGVSVWRIDNRSRRIHFTSGGSPVVGMRGDADGVPIDELRASIHPDDREAVVRGAEQALASDRIVDVVARYRNDDGRWHSLLTRRVADRDGEGRVLGLTGVSLDVSDQVADRSRAEALGQSTRLVAEAMGVGFWSRDIDAGTSHWDEQMFRIHRRPPRSGPPGFDDWIDDHVHPQDRQRVRELHRQASVSWAPVVDVTFRASDDAAGSERWVQSWTRRILRDGRRLAFGMHLDVTERQRTQALVERERARTQFAIEAAGVGIWERSVEGHARYWNEAMYRLRGLAADDPRPIDELARQCAHPDDLPELERQLQSHIARGTPYRIEFRVRAPGGGWRWLVTQGGALHAADGSMVGMAGVNLDITERKQADALRQQQVLAEQTRRDEAAFLARISHEFRTPMNAVLGFTQLLEDDRGEPPSPRQRERLQRIAEAGSQMMLLVDDLLDLAQIEATVTTAAVEAQALPDVLAEVQRSLGDAAAARGVQLRRSVLRADTAVCADRRRLVQLVSQLVAHALRRQRPGGTVELVCDGEAGAPAGDTPQRCVRVCSDAPGYGEAESAALFAPLRHPGDGSRGGGIGMALAWRLAQALGGRIEVSNTAGGSEIGLWLPVERPAEPPAEPVRTAPARPTLAARASSPPLRVLCVEDNPVNLLLVRELLALRPGVRLRAATDGLSGIDMALAERPDVLLLDLQLPDIGGLEVLGRLRAEPSMAGCVYVALSANAMPEHIAAARSAGFDDYWTKPIDFERFLSGIDRLAAR